MKRRSIRHAGYPAGAASAMATATPFGQATKLDLVLNLRGTIAIGDKRRHSTRDVMLVMPRLPHPDSLACCN